MKFIKYNLWKSKRALSASREFKALLWNKLEQKFPVWHWYQTHAFRFAVGLSVLVLVCASFTTGAYAYVNPEVTQGSLLYPIKRALEKIEEKTKITPEAKAKFNLKKIQRREAEAIVLKTKNKKAFVIEKKTKNLEKKLKEKLERKVEKIEVKSVKKQNRQNKNKQGN